MKWIRIFKKQVVGQWQALPLGGGAGLECTAMSDFGKETRFDTFPLLC